MSEPLVVIGNGMAAARFVDELSSRALGRYAIAVVGEEPRLAYNRVLLSSVLAGEVASSDIELKPAHWWRDRGVTLRYGCRATAVDTNARTVALADGQTLAVLEARVRDRLAAGPARDSRHDAARRHHVPRHRRHLDHLAPRRIGGPSCGHRRRAAGAGSRLRSRQGRRARHRAASDGPADGAPARSAGRTDVAARGRAQWVSRSCSMQTRPR